MEGEGDEPLLGAVVEVAFESPSFCDACFDDPCSRVFGLLELGAQFGKESLVLERESSCARHAVEQCGVLAKRCVVHERSDFAAVTLEEGDRSSCNRRDVDLFSVDVDIFVGVWEPVAELEGRVA